MGTVSHFLGIKFTYTHHQDQSFSLCLSQQAFVEQLVSAHGSTKIHKAHIQTPYRSGFAIDTIKFSSDIPESKKIDLL